VTSDRCRDAAPPGLLAGIDLFNRREFFACHEVLEEIWRAERDPVRLLYQGTLQIGVGFHHLGRGNWVGAVRQLEKGISGVAHFVPGCMGIDTDRLTREARACLDLLRTLGADGLERFDWSLVPTIAVDRRAQG